MKKIITALFLTFMACFASQSFAASFDKNDTFMQAKVKLNLTDCSKEPVECRYYAAIEYVAFSNACFATFEDKFKSPIPKQDRERAKVSLDKWKAISEPKMHEYVLSESNILRIKIENDMIQYLKKVPSDDWGIECSRIALIEQNKNPEEMSDILQSSLNYKEWIKGIDEQQQKDFQKQQKNLQSK